uniref:Non-LTR retroelement reverse transcriptase n=1 Tax=Solanum tuberosum TaxID=4113 RepID=M1DZC7_SOLTU
MVYAKCSADKRIELWNDLFFISNNYSGPWLVGGDFNVILGEDEKKGGLLVYIQEYEEFAFCVNSCGMFDINLLVVRLLGGMEELKKNVFSKDKKSIALIMNTLKDYENQSGQKVNKEKICLYMFSKASNALIREMEEVISFVRELKALYGLTLCGTSTAKDIDLNGGMEGKISSLEDDVNG